ncbi:hypothetical protein WJT74_03655 [Sphingomicrobium sp. XHP0239]|uniref:hypothetical protein n=1 Tax=Sphingomicrobium maritimum TaxID=3133972 RepID=UPI0031CC6546
MTGHPLRGKLGDKSPSETPDDTARGEREHPAEEAVAPAGHPDSDPHDPVAPPTVDGQDEGRGEIFVRKGAARGADDTLELTDENYIADAEPAAPHDFDFADDHEGEPSLSAPSPTTDTDPPFEANMANEPSLARGGMMDSELHRPTEYSPDDGHEEDDVGQDDPAYEDDLSQERSEEIEPDPNENDVGGNDPVDWDAEPYTASFDETPSTPAGRMLLAGILLVLGLGWIALVGYVAGTEIGATPDLGALATLIAIACAPLILLALVWMMFGRTRRREAEAFTRQVALMRAEAQALDQRLHSMSANLGANRSRLGELAGELEGRADQATERMRTVADELEHGASRLAQHGVTLDTAANNARADMTALVETLPDAEQRILSLSQSLQGAGSGAIEDIRSLEAAIASLGARTNETESRMREAREGLSGQLDELDRSGQKAIGQVEAAQRSTGELVDGLLARSASTLEQIRGGIAQQAGAVQELLEQARGGIERSSNDAASALAARVRDADGALTQLGENVRARDEETRKLLVNLDSGLSSLEERFARFSDDGDGRAHAIGTQLSQVREQLAATRAEAQEQDGMIERLATRTGGMRETLNALSAFLNQQLAGDIGGAQDGMERLVSTGEVLTPQLTDIRANATRAHEALDATGSRIEGSRTALAAMLELVDRGAGDAEQRLAELQQSIAILQEDAKSLSEQTGPQLLDALTKVQDASARAREAAREAIAQAIPEAAENLSNEARSRLEAAIADVVANQLEDVGRASERAVEAARSASDRLSAQMLSIGQTASALESHMAEIEDGTREGQTEQFAAQVSLLMESMNSAAIDVEKILSDEVDDKSWAAYLKGERGVFTRKAVRLLSAGEAREIGSIYDDDPEFRGAVNRFIHDFEAMLRRVLAERDGAIIGVTLMSSDMGKLYAALAQAVDRRAR